MEHAMSVWHPYTLFKEPIHNQKNYVLSGSLYSIATDILTRYLIVNTDDLTLTASKLKLSPTNVPSNYETNFLLVYM